MKNQGVSYSTPAVTGRLLKVIQAGANNDVLLSASLLHY